MEANGIIKREVLGKKKNRANGLHKNAVVKRKTSMGTLKGRHETEQ